MNMHYNDNYVPMTCDCLRYKLCLNLFLVTGEIKKGDRITVNPGSTFFLSHHGQKNVTFCAIQRPNKEVVLQNDLKDNPNSANLNTR